jgi:hypothetical protein
MRKLFLLTCLLALSVALFVWYRGWLTALPLPNENLAAPDEPWADSPYRNVRPEVQYVDDQACIDCHRGEAESFRQHPMGRSLQPIRDWQPGDRLSAKAHNPFRNQGFEFRVDRSEGRVFHDGRWLDPAGKPVVQLEAVVQYVIGSGTRGQSFLAERDGYLFQSPISWYGRKGIWDLSPGFKVDQWLDRAIGGSCLFCHSNRVEIDGNHLNRYRPPIFRGHAIGCERCHGPGELHVQLREQGTPVEGEDRTIVNPARLEPELRESVCQQCHLNGVVRVVRRGRREFDFRPGFPFDAFWAVYVAGPDISQGQIAVGQVEQMHESKCFQASQGHLGCISCHDPHSYPTAADRVGYYRSRCLECHQEQGCGLAAGERQKQSGNDCVACHMPPLSPYDVAHTAMTDHRIRSRPGEPGSERARSASVPAGPLVRFGGGAMTGGLDTERDLGMAFQSLCRKQPEFQGTLAQDAASRLRRSLAAWPDDLPALEACAQCLGYQGQAQEMLEQHERVLARAPDWEASVAGAGTAADALGDNEKALAFWERAVALSPWYSAYHDAMAKTLAKMKRWPDAIRECDRALELCGARLDTRILLIGCLAQGGKGDRARKEFDLLVQLDPQRKEQLERWFARQIE